jgi:aldose 1-epimerase
MRLIEIVDSASGSSATIAPDLGFNCFRFEAKLADGRGISVLSSAPGFAEGGQRPSHSGIPLLFPYPNRIQSGRYSWDSKQYLLPQGAVPYDKTGNAIHGFCIDRPWRVSEQTHAAAIGLFQLSIDAPDRLTLWPTDAEISVMYRVLGSCLRSEIRVRNPSDRPLPWGFGTHPYFSVPLSAASSASQCRIFAPTDSVWRLNECLPDGQKLTAPAGARLDQAPAFGGLKLDDVYTDLVPDNGQIVCRITDPDAGLIVEQRSSTDFRELVAFTPYWSSSVCLEPYTCVTNAINLQSQGIKSGLQLLPPGGEWKGWIEIEAKPQ